MLPVLSIAGLTLPVGPLAFLLAFFVGGELAGRALGRLAPMEDEDQWKAAMSSATLWVLPAGLVTARLAYVLRFRDLYLASPQLALSPRPGSLMLLPGLLGGGAVVMLVLARQDIPLSRLLDALAVGVTGALAVYYAGQFLTGSGYGTLSALPWAVDLWGETRHPVQVYEAVASVGILVVLWSRLSKALPGEIFWYFLTLQGASVLVLTAYRASSATWIQGIRIPQVIGLAALLAGLFVLSFYARQRESVVDAPAAGLEAG